jgi:hypothetical protein
MTTDGQLPSIPTWVPPLDTGQPSASELEDLGRSIKATVTARHSVIPIVYGRDRLFGSVIVVTVDETGGYLYVAYSFGEGEIEGYETLFVDGVDVNDATTGFLTHIGAAVELYTGTAAQTASPFLSTALAGYTDTLPNVAYVVLRVPVNSTSGFPRCEAIVQGKKIYDPRLDTTRTDISPVGSGAHRENDPATWEFSQNPAICFRDVLLSHTAWDFFDQGIVDLADYNDELVDGVKRREIGLTLAKPNTVEKWMKGFRTYMGAFLGWEAGKVRVIPNRGDVDAQGAVILDGTASTRVSIGDVTAYDFGSSQNFTVEASFNIPAKDGTNQQWIVGKKSFAGSGAGYAFYFQSGNGNNLRFVISDGVSAPFDDYTATDLFDGQYHHVAATVDRTADELILYVDGVAAGSPVDISSVTGSLASSTDFRVGERGGIGQLLTGSVDEVRVWDDVRTPTEIAANRLNEIEDPETVSSLIGYWKFNELSGSVAVDSSGSGNDGTLQGNAVFGFGYSQLMPAGVVMHIGVDDIVKDSIRVKRRSLRSVPNRVAVDYEDSSGSKWNTERAQKDSPRIAANQEAPRLSRVSLPGIHNASQAQREATERLNWYLTDLECKVSLFDEGWQLQHGSIVAVTHPIGLDAKLMRVTRTTAQSGRWTIDMSEYDPAVYSNEVITNPTTPDTNLGNPLAVPTVSGLTLVEELFKYKNGLTGSRVRVSFTGSAYPFLNQYLVEGYVDGAKVWQTQTQSTTVVTPGVEELVSDAAVDYEVRVYIQSPFATGAAATEVVSILGKLAVPGDVPTISLTQTSADSVKITWGEAVDLDIWRYEVRVGAVTSAWEAATTLELVDGLSYQAEGLAIGSYRFFVKARDSVGNESAAAIKSSITLSRPSPVASISGFEVASEVRLNWPAVTTGFVERYRIAYDTIPPTGEITLDSVDTLRFQTKDVPEGTWSFLVYAADKNGVEATSAPNVEIEVTSDADAFLADTYDFVSPTLTNMVEYALRLDNRQIYITNMADVFLSSPSDFNTFSAEALANYHSTGASEWLSETKDFGVPLTGSWNLSQNVVAILGTVTVVLELSTDNITYTSFSSSAKGEYRYARVRITTPASPGTGTAFVTSPIMSLKINVVPLEESGSATTSATAGVTINLSREYAAVKQVNAQPKNSTDAVMAIIDNIVVGANTGLSCDGTNYLVGGDWATLDFGTGDFSIEYWTQHTGSANNDQSLIAKRNGGAAGWEVRQSYGISEVVFIIDDATTEISCTTTGDALPNDGGKHHVAITVDRIADEVRVFVDAVEVGGSPFDISTLTGSVDNANNFNVFANSTGGFIHEADGLVDDLRMWSDERTGTEITANYQSELDMTITQPNLVGYWKMNGTTSAVLGGGTTNDAILASTNDLTDTGAGDLTFIDMGASSPVQKINSFDVYVFDIFGQQLVEDVQWDWKAV